MPAQPAPERGYGAPPHTPAFSYESKSACAIGTRDGYTRVGGREGRTGVGCWDLTVFAHRTFIFWNVRVCDFAGVFLARECADCPVLLNYPQGITLASASVRLRGGDGGGELGERK